MKTLVNTSLFPHLGGIIAGINATYDHIEKWWESALAKAITGAILVLTFLLAFTAIELGRHDLLPPFLLNALPGNHFYAISLAFTLLLYIEVIDLVFGLAESMSKAVGRQFQIFSLILLRQPFKEFSPFSEPIQWIDVVHAVPGIASNACGALFIFAALALYYRMIRHQPITDSSEHKILFITAKKLISLALLLAFAAIGIYYAATHLAGQHGGQFFITFYTILIFSDILIVLLSLRYSSSFPVVFRNSGFALATVALRLGLVAPVFFDAGIGAGAVLYVLGLTAVYNFFVSPLENKQQKGD